MLHKHILLYSFLAFIIVWLFPVLKFSVDFCFVVIISLRIISGLMITFDEGKTRLTSIQFV